MRPFTFSNMNASGFFDSIILGPSVASLDAYRVEKHPVALVASSNAPKKNIGNAFTDPENPIRKIFICN